MEQRHRNVASTKKGGRTKAQPGQGQGTNGAAVQAAHRQSQERGAEPDGQASANDFEIEFRVPLTVQICVRNDKLAHRKGHFLYADEHEGTDIGFDSLDTLAAWLHELAEAGPYDADYRAYLREFAERLLQEMPARVDRVLKKEMALAAELQGGK